MGVTKKQLDGLWYTTLNTLRDISIDINVSGAKEQMEEAVRWFEFKKLPWYKRWWRRVVSLVSLSFLRKNYGR